MSSKKLNSLTNLRMNRRDQRSIREEYLRDPEFKEMFQNPPGDFTIRNGLLLCNHKIWIPHGTTRLRLLHDYHRIAAKGHIGYANTLTSRTATCHWKNIRKDTKDYVRTFDEFQRHKANTRAPLRLLQPLDPPTQRWSLLTMDFIVPLPRTARSHCRIFVVADRLTKMIRLAPMPESSSAPVVANIFHHSVYRHHGLPTEIIPDRDPIFMSKLWNSLFKLLGVRLMPSSTHDPETDGQTERMNRQVEEILHCFAMHSQKNRDDLLVDVEVADNSSPNATTPYSPFFLTYGYGPRTLPAEHCCS